nr:precorrin-6y C5,15-methyltransferase (decarboxylating) subunit CbiE [uncultured Leptotrichia sp.]
MEKIKILGLGPGNLDYTLPIVLKKIEESDVIIGGKRHLESLGKYTKNKEYFYISPDLSKVIEFINENRDKKISLVVSGDTGFYSFLAFIKKHFCDNELEVVAGISSLQYMFAKISDFWNNAYISSVHGKNFDYVSKLREYEKIGLLTDFSKNTPQNIAKKLFENGFENAKIFVGENLSYENEKIYEFKVSKLKDYEEKFGINVVIIKR